MHQFLKSKSDQNIQLSTRPGIEPATSGLGGRDLTTAPAPRGYFGVERIGMTVGNPRKLP